MSKRSAPDSAAVSAAKKTTPSYAVVDFFKHEKWGDLDTVCWALVNDAAGLEAAVSEKYYRKNVISLFIEARGRSVVTIEDLARLVASGAASDPAAMFEVAIVMLTRVRREPYAPAQLVSWALARTHLTMLDTVRGGRNLLAGVLAPDHVRHGPTLNDNLLGVLALHCKQTVEYERPTDFLHDFNQACAGFRVVINKEDVTKSLMSVVRAHADRYTEPDVLSAAVEHSVRVGCDFEWLRACCADFKPAGQYPWIVACVKAYGPMVADSTWIAAAESFDPATNHYAAEAHAEVLALLRTFAVGRGEA